jgi:hypothetical protein
MQAAHRLKSRKLDVEMLPKILPHESLGHGRRMGARENWEIPA